MTVGKKIAAVLLALIVLGAGGTALYFYFSDEVELPDVVEKEVFTYPLTGLKAEDEESTKMRPLCVKIPNDAKARPQYGINSADVVYETMVEGGLTRLNAIFQSNIPEEVWPTRSARLSDVTIVPQYNGMLFFSGANDQVDAAIANNNVTNMNWDHASSIYYRGDTGRGSLYSLTIKLKEAYEVAKENGYETILENPAQLHFSGVKYDDSTDSEGESDNTENSSKLDSLDESPLTGFSVKVNISGSSRIEFKWDADKDKYLKWANDNPHLDASDDVQVNVSNVIIMWATYTPQSKTDAAGSVTYDTTLTGSGDAAIFKNGIRYDCKWEAEKDSPPRFYDSEGNEVLLEQGKTWIVVPPTNTDITVEAKTE